MAAAAVEVDRIETVGLAGLPMLKFVNNRRSTGD